VQTGNRLPKYKLENGSEQVVTARFGFKMINILVNINRKFNE
jgi:hypothetical protein